MSQTLKFVVEWPQELAAGIRGGSEDVTLTLEGGGWDVETLDTLRQEMLSLLGEVLDGVTHTAEDVAAREALINSLHEGDEND